MRIPLEGVPGPIPAELMALPEREGTLVRRSPDDELLGFFEPAEVGGACSLNGWTVGEEIKQLVELAVGDPDSRVRLAAMDRIRLRQLDSLRLSGRLAVLTQKQTEEDGEGRKRETTASAVRVMQSSRNRTLELLRGANVGVQLPSLIGNAHDGNNQYGEVEATGGSVAEGENPGQDLAESKLQTGGTPDSGLAGSHLEPHAGESGRVPD